MTNHQSRGNLSYPFRSPPDNIESSPFDARTVSSKLLNKSALIVHRQHWGCSPRLKHIILHLISIHPPGVHSFLMANLDCLCASASGSSIGLQLCFDASIHCAKEVCCCVDRLADSQYAVVLENDGLGVSECFGESATFFMG